MGRQSRFWLRWVPVGFLALAVLASFAWLAWYGMARWQLGRIKAELAAAGWPATAAGVIPPEIPEADNAAPLLERAWEIWKKLKDSEGFIMPRFGVKAADHDPRKFDAAKLEKFQEQMRSPEVGEMLRLVREASNKPAARVDRDYSKGLGINMDLEHFALAAAKLLGAKAWLAAREGNQQEAVGNLWAASRLASFWLKDVLFIGWLVGSAMDRVSTGNAQIVIADLPDGSFRMEYWGKLDEIWEAHAKGARGDLARALEAERVLSGSWIFEGVLGGSLSLADTMIQGAQLPAKDPEEVAALRRGGRVYTTAFAPWFLGDYTAYLRFMLLLHDTVKNGKAGDVIKEPLANSIPKVAFFAQMMAVGFDGTPDLIAEYEVKLQLGRLGLALEDFRSRHGKYPETLQELELPGAMITDPFSGTPFVYRPDGGSVMVYSIGTNRTDDGGVSGKRRDIVWRVERK